MKKTQKRPQIKFYKNSIDDIISGKKTLEPRPRSLQWIKKISNAEMVDFTYGPRFKTPRIFASAKIIKIAVKPFENTTRRDLKKISLGWQNKPLEDFIKEYKAWFAKDLNKGYPVVWIYFKLKSAYEKEK